GIVFTVPVSSAQSAPVQTAPPQMDLPGINVTAPYTSTHGGYLISGDFKVDPRMPTVVFPGQALVKDDIISVQPVHLNDDEYLVLQECASANCHQANLVRVWNAGGALGTVRNSDARVRIKHENKYFIWMQRLPRMPFPDCDRCNTSFTRFEPLSPPMTLEPIGALVAYHRGALASADFLPVPVVSQKHEGSTFVVTFKGGATVRIKRMHAAR
ncbi:MAG: hypothetical protein M3Y93_13000, partial [Pseudomonadota bacterium]|nr:hypothetical protein [Pseudomonadota bacterium]